MGSHAAQCFDKAELFKGRDLPISSEGIKVRKAYCFKDVESNRHYITEMDVQKLPRWMREEQARGECNPNQKSEYLENMPRPRSIRGLN